LREVSPDGHLATDSIDQNNVFHWRYLPDVFALLVILLCSLVLFKDAIFQGWIFYEFDTKIYYYPITAWAQSAISFNGIDLWSPSIYGGFPLYADGEAGLLYPLNWILLRFLQPEQMFVWSPMLHQFLAGAFCYIFLRVLQPNRLPALIAGITLAFGSFFVTQMHHVNVVDSAVWLPAVLLFAELAIRRVSWQRVLYVALGGAAFGMQLLTIHIQPVLMTLLILALYLLFRTLSSGTGSLFRRGLTAVMIGVGIVAMGLALGAVQLLPLYELALNAVRGEGSSYQFATSFGPSIPGLATLIFPYFFRFEGYDYWTLWFRWEATVYVGIGPLLLALIAVIFHRTRETIFFAVLAIVMLLITLGDYSPIKLYWLLWQVPGFSMARAPGRYSLLLVFSIAVLAGFGVYYLQKRLAETEKPGYPRTVSLALAGSAVIGVILFVATQLLRSWMLANKTASLEFISNNYLSLRHQAEMVFSPDRVYGSIVNTLAWQNWRTMLSFVFLFGILFVLGAWLRLRRPVWLWQGLLVAFVAADLLAFGMIFHPEMPATELSATSDAGQFLYEKNDLHRIYALEPVGMIVPNRLLPLDIQGVRGYSSLDMTRYRDFMKLMGSGNSKLFDLWNVRYLVARKAAQIPETAGKTQRVFEDDIKVIYERSSYLPRAYTVKQGIAVDAPSTALSLLTQPEFDPSRSVILESEDNQSILPLIPREDEADELAAPALPKDDTRTEADQVTISAYGPSSVSIEAKVGGDRYLVLSDTFYPGWSATVNGQPATIYRANYMFRAVYLPKGSNTVVFSYDPLSF
jgi:hypothetical protein